MLPEHLDLTYSRFREAPGKYLAFVEKTGGHLWLHRHGRFRAAVIPSHHLTLLETLIGTDLREERGAMERKWEKLRRAKAAQLQQEMRRAEAGLGLGGRDAEFETMRAEAGRSGRLPYGSEPPDMP